MSVVTGVMLIVGARDFGDDAGPVAEVQAWLAERGWPQLKDVADSAGGNKHPQFEAWCAGINGFVDEAAFTRFVMARKWMDSLILVVQPEDGGRSVYVPGMGSYMVYE